MSEVDNWELVTEQEVGAYLPNKKDSINVREFSDGIDANFDYEIGVQNKDTRDYVGKIKHDYKDIKRSWLKSAGRGLYNFIPEMIENTAKGGLSLAETFAIWQNGGTEKDKQLLTDAFNSIRAKNEEWWKTYKYEKDEKDVDFAFQGGNVLASIGTSLLTKNPRLVASAFGTSQYGSITSELREKGVDVTESNLLGVPLGVAEGLLEQYGLHAFLENLATKGLGKFLLKQTGTEAIQELSQTGVEEGTIKTYEIVKGKKIRGKTALDISKDIVSSAFWGGVGGLLGGGIYAGASSKYRQQAENKLVQNGLTEAEAKDFVDSHMFSNDEMRQELADMLNKESDQTTLLNGSYEDDVKRFLEESRESIVSEEFDIRDELKESFLKEGVSDENAETVSILEEKFARRMYDLTGETPRERMENRRLRIEQENPTDEEIEDFEVVDESELSEEEIARLEEKERLRELEEDIPFQKDILRKGDKEYYQTIENEKDLVTTHGTTLQKLNDALELGAMPMPSLAVTKVENAPYSDYGEILFIGGKDIIDPRRDERNRVFGADIYSTRKVTPIYEINKDGYEYISRHTGNVSKKGTNFWLSNISYGLETGRDFELKNLYLATKGKITDMDSATYSIVTNMTEKENEDFEKWKNKFINEYTDRKIFEGFTPSGNRKYSEYNLNNILKNMLKQSLRGSEGGAEGNAHALRGILADEYKSIQEIKSAKNKLTDKETYEKMDNQIWEATSKLSDLLVSEKKAEELESRWIAPDDYVIEEVLKNIKPNSNISNMLKKADLRYDAKAVNSVKGYIELIKSLPVKYFEAKPQRAVDFTEFAGAIMPESSEYDNVAKRLEEYGLKVVRSSNYKDALNGFDDVFFQNKDETVYRGSYSPAKNLISLFKHANKSTIIHELGHRFTIEYVNTLERLGRTEELKGFYKWLGIESIDDATTETWEKMARGFETYAMEGVAPNSDTETLFSRLKKWLLDVYTDIKGTLVAPEEINDDVRDFFDKMLAGDIEKIDIEDIKGKTNELVQIINSALKGEDVTIDGLSIKDIDKLIKATKSRLPRMPKNLEQEIRSAGGIDIDFAKQIGIYDSKKGNMNGFFKQDGYIDREDTLVEFLTDLGFLSYSESEDYDQTSEIQERAIDLVERANSVYRESDMETIYNRESLESAINEANALLSKIDYEDVKKAIKTLKDKEISGVQNDTLKYIKARLKSIDKDYKKVVDNTIRVQKKDLKDKRDAIIEYIKSQNISNENKYKLIDEVKKANSEVTFEKAVKEVKERADRFYEREQKKLLADMIHKEIKKSKPTDVMKQRYDYETNKLFMSLREYDKMTQLEANEELSKIWDEEEPSQYNLIKLRYLNYKANGMESSPQLMEKVLDDILSSKRLGSMIKNASDMEKAINRENLKQDVMIAIDRNDADKNTIKTRIGNLYRKGFTNLYSLIDSISSKELAKKFEMETVLNNAEIRYFKHTDNITKKIMKVFDVKSKGALLNKFADLGQNIDSIYTQDGTIKYDLSKLDIIDIYNSIKNDKKREDYFYHYGEEQVMRLVSLLSKNEKIFADMLMDDVNTLYPETNKVYIENYGMDLKKVDNYWMATSDSYKETNLLQDFYSQQTTPSFYKERVKQRVRPLPKNAWSKYLKHINESIYMINTASKYKELKDTFKSKRVKNKIENKFGSDVYSSLMDRINALSLGSKSESLNYVESAFGKILNNFVVSKIAVAPTVFAGQLTSITNYSEDVDSISFYKNFAYGLSHPKEVYKFMMDNAGDFLKTRYAGGFSEAMSRVQKEASEALQKKYIVSPNVKYTYTNALTSFVRLGDIGAIAFGGYAQIKTNLDNGMSLEDSLKKFEFDTLRSQQSSNVASLSPFQQSTGFSRLFLAFKNTQHQYFRKIVDSIMEYQRGEITTNQCAKTIVNYMIVQSSLYVIAKNLVKSAMGLSDDDDNLLDGVLEQIALGSIDAIPVLSDTIHYAYKKLTGQYAKGIFNTTGFDDLEKAINTLYKKEKNMYDWVEIMAPLIEGTTAIPVKRYSSILKKYTEN